MTEARFLYQVYSCVTPGMPVIKPKKVSTILNVTESGNIYYRIGTDNMKAITRSDLVAVYAALSAGTLTNQALRRISGSARPCNTTTLQWLLRTTDLANEGIDGAWQKNW